MDVDPSSAEAGARRIDCDVPDHMHVPPAHDNPTAQLPHVPPQQACPAAPHPDVVNNGSQTPLAAHCDSGSQSELLRHGQCWVATSQVLTNHIPTKQTAVLSPHDVDHMHC
jgi:hypothetical protein